MALSGNLWPIHPKPKDDELLSSWMARSAEAFSMTTFNFFSAAFPGWDIWRHDIDSSTDDSLLRFIAKKTGTRYERALSSTFRHMEGLLYESHRKTTDNLWIMPLSMAQVNIKRFTLQCCTSCLREDKVPYFRKAWRIAFVTVCRKHHCMLRDRCHACGDPVNYSMSKPLGMLLMQCRQCGADLRDAPITSPEFDRQMCYQSALFSILKKGWTNVPGYGPTYSHLYFNGLHAIIRMMATGEKSEKLRNYMFMVMGEKHPYFKGKQHSIEHLDVNDRFTLLRIAQWLFEDWPNRLIEVCKEAKVYRYDMVQDMRGVPYWLRSVIHGHIFEPQRRTSDSEIKAAILYLKSTNQKVSESNVSKLMGIGNLFVNRRKRLRDFW